MTKNYKLILIQIWLENIIIKIKYIKKNIFIMININFIFYQRERSTLLTKNRYTNKCYLNPKVFHVLDQTSSSHP
jgi:hypothetical protein